MGRASLRDPAIRLAGSLTALMPDEPEAWGLLALMRLQHSRRDARIGADGVSVTLEEQDRARWDRAAIAQGWTLSPDERSSWPPPTPTGCS